MRRSARMIAVIAGKGGVGKTTTVANLGAAFAERGWRTLVVDCDPQSNLTYGLGFDTYESRPTISEVLRGEVAAADAITTTDVDCLDLLPANTNLISVEETLPSSLGRELLLRDALVAGRIAEQYDYVIFDTPPSFTFHTIIALAAARFALVPLQISGFALRGLREVTRTISVARRSLNHDLVLLGSVPTFVDRRTRFSRDVVDGLGKAEGIRVFESHIARSVRVLETSILGIPVLTYAPASPSAAQYRALAEEVRTAIEGVAPVGPADATDDADAEQVIVGRAARLGLAPVAGVAVPRATPEDTAQPPAPALEREPAAASVATVAQAQPVAPTWAFELPQPALAAAGPLAQAPREAPPGSRWEQERRRRGLGALLFWRRH